MSLDNDLIEVRTSPIHGKGVFARQRIARRVVVGRYEGRRYPAGEFVEGDSQGGMVYLFALSDGATIDGAQGGNATRHLNHSCEPNCEAFERYEADGTLVVEIRTRRTVPAGKELFIDYELTIEPGDEASYPCHCGVGDCRGTMAAPALR